MYIFCLDAISSHYETLTAVKLPEVTMSLGGDHTELFQVDNCFAL